MMKKLKKFIGDLYSKTSEEQSSTAHVGIKRSLEATVVRACKQCGASGIDEHGYPIGEYCPQCGSVRPESENLGQIWFKTY